ncbi:MAG: branched-chain amino acid ABC transporter substrate-binding protein [Desulfovibrionaceae bacterium]|jgi:branched-chain amino acid transport system substrate-binding protein|nr:branched-chain amino acid ABC transporter substrate-binding protein [Desulfovibrionaceae bacterium]
MDTRNAPRTGLRHGLKLVAALLMVAMAAVPALAKETVKVGFIAPLTGGVSANGIGGRNSAELAVILRNQDPKAKYHYEFVAMDDECKPNIGVQAATKMASDKDVVALVPHYCSAVALSTVKIYHRFGLPVIVWGAVHPGITYDNDFKEVHRINGTMINQNEEAARFMTAQGYKTFAVMHDTTDYGKSHKDYFTKYLAENGGTVVGVFGVTSDQQDFTAELTKIKALNPDVVYFGGLTPLGVRIRSQMEKIGVNAQFEGVSGIKSDSFIEGLGPELAEGCLSFIEGAPVEKLPGGAFFAKAYEEQKFAQPAEAYGPFAFAAMNLFLDTIEKVGPDRKKIDKAINTMGSVDSIVGKVAFDDHGQNTVATISKYVVQDGKWVVWEDSEYAGGKRSLVKK